MSPVFRLLGAAANVLTDEVWIQGELVDGEWRFHDGSPFAVDQFCPFSDPIRTSENRIRMIPRLGYTCHDINVLWSFAAVCEINFRIPF
jgi:hypothetical protein